jgi:hypothetical protein
MSRRWVLAVAGLFGLAAAGVAGPPLGAAEPGAAVNPRPAFLVRVAVDHPNHVYREGDKLVARVRSEKDGFLYLFNITPDGRVNCLFPNKFQRDNRIKAGQAVAVPDEKAGFDFPIQGPKFGRETLKALVALKPLEELVRHQETKDVFSVEALTKLVATPIDPERLTGLERDIGLAARPQPVAAAQERLLAQVAEHDVAVLTLRKGEPVPAAPTVAGTPRPGPAKPRRLGAFIGISAYKDGNIRPLTASHKDAQEMARFMKASCGLDEAITLTNDQATLARIEELIRVRLPAATRAGDEVFLFWSGHGGRVSDTTGLEPDGLSEYLVPYDGKLGRAAEVRASMLLDVTFARWVQALDGRKVVIILDACHSGGQAAGAKGLGDKVDGERDSDLGFFQAPFQRAKNIGQKEVAVLASSKATQPSYERREGDLSVMTYCLLERLKAAGQVTLKEGFAHVQKAVPAYVSARFKAREAQTPVLYDQTTPPVYLRP